jgi:hypothetical protein
MKFFPNNIHPAIYHFTHSKKTEKPDNITILLLGGIVYRKKTSTIDVLVRCMLVSMGWKEMHVVSYYMGLGSIRQEKLA